VFRIRRDTFDHLGHRLSKEVVHGVTSLTADQATPEQIAGLVRNRWRIENKSHWVRMSCTAKTTSIADHRGSYQHKPTLK
jgi:predicted transposase YbfD/YdcC